MTYRQNMIKENQIGPNDWIEYKINGSYYIMRMIVYALLIRFSPNL